MEKIKFLFIVMLTGIFGNIYSQTINYTGVTWTEKSISKIELKNSETNSYEKLQLMFPFSLYLNSDNTSVKVSNQALIEMILGKHQDLLYNEITFINGISIPVESRETIAFRGEYTAKNTSGSNQNSFKGALLFYYSKGISGALEIRCQGKNGQYKYIRVFFNDQKPISIVNGSSVQNLSGNKTESNETNYNFINRSSKVAFQTDKYEERINSINKLNISQKIDFIIDLPNKYIKTSSHNQKESLLEILSISNDIFEGKTKILILKVRNNSTTDEFKVQIREDPGKSFYYTIYATTKANHDYLTFYKEIKK